MIITGISNVTCQVEELALGHLVIKIEMLAIVVDLDGLV
jgi:hypothetical protein